MMQLSIKDFEGRSTVVTLAEGQLTVGRDESNDVCLTERNVSRHHARLIVQGGSVVIEPVKATWGTRLNQQLLRGRSEFQVGDVVQIGDYTLELQRDGARPRDNALVDGGGAPGAASGAAAAAAPAQRAADGRPADARPVDNATSIVNLADIRQAITAPGDVVALPAAEQPRLVVESENLRGLELRVTRIPTTIGRAADSADLVVDHRSISKEHARLSRRADGTWEILDLGSSNGMQVNGEPYSKSAVRSGDVITLGHVALRFLAAGAVAAPVSGGAAKGRALLIAAIVVTLLLAGGLAAFLALSGPGQAPAAPAKPATVAPVRAAPAPAEAEAEPEESAADRVRKIEKLRKAGMIREALALAHDSERRDGGNAELALMVRKLEAEIDALAALDQAEGVLEGDAKGAMDRAGQVLESLPEDSPLRQRTELVQTKAKTRLIVERIGLAERALVKRDYATAADLAEQVQALEPDNERAADVLAKVKRATPGDERPRGDAVKVARPGATAQEPSAKPSPKPKAEPTVQPEASPKPAAKPPAEAAPAPADKPAAGAMSAKEHYDAGRTAASSGDTEGAIKHFLDAVKGGYGKAHGPLARLYQKSGNNAKCREHGTKYIQKYPDAGDAQAMEGLVEACR